MTPGKGALTMMDWGRRILRRRELGQADVGDIHMMRGGVKARSIKIHASTPFI